MKIEELLSSFARQTRDPVVVGYRRPGEDVARHVWSNRSCEAAFGYGRDELDGLPIETLLAAEEIDEFHAKIRLSTTRGDDHFIHETLCRRQDGTTFWASVSVSFLPSDENGGRFTFCSFHDLSALKAREQHAEAALQGNREVLTEAEAARARLLLAIDAIPTPIAIWDRDWSLVVCNNAFASRLLGMENGLDAGTTLDDFLLKAACAGHLVDAIGREEEWASEASASLRKGPIDDIIRYTDGAILRAVSTTAPNGDTVVFNSDVTEFTEQKRILEIRNVQLELARAEADMRALHDDLTSLGNRRFISEGLHELLEEQKRLGGEVATLAIDLDRFKQINDTLGHAAGDYVLAAVAGRLRNAVESGDLIARVGGDEFVILRRVTGPSHAPEILGQTIVETMSQPFRFDEAELRLGASVGIASTPISPAADLLTNADIALYKAKSSGRSAVATFDERDLAEMMNAKTLSDEVLDAVEKKSFEPYFQPQIDALTGKIVGVEALARWRHATRGVLSPAEFLKAAADLTVLDDIDEIIFDKALELCGNSFEIENAPNLSFNVSEQRFRSISLLSAIRKASGYPGSIAIELLETIFFEDQGDAFHLQLDALRDAGVGIEIDDFGSGRASIIALEQIAPDRLKIDRRLVMAVADSDRSRKLVKSIVDIGHALGIGVTAEGVETEAQAARLTELGCDRLQGFLYGKPMPFEQLRNILQHSPAISAAV